MNSLDRLIDELCPEGVQHLPFGQIGEILRGSGVQKKDFIPEGKPALHYGQIYTYYGVSADRANRQVSLETYNRSKKALPGDVIIADASENDEDLAQGVAWLGDSDVALSNHTLVFRSPMDPVFVSYYLRTRSFDIQKRRYLQGTKIKGLSSAAFGKITIPVPPLEIQQEIVRILDQFTQLEAELEAELEKRRLQYAYYRDKLLSFDALDGGAQVRWTTLGEIATISRGGKVVASKIQVISSGQLEVDWMPIATVAEVTSGFGFPQRFQGRPAGEIPFFKVSDMNLAENQHQMNRAKNYISMADLVKLKAKLVPGGSVIFPKIGAAIATNKKRLLVEDATFDNNVMGITPGEQLLGAYLHYWIQTLDLGSLANHSGAVPSIRKSTIERLLVPVPPLEVQQEIVRILDQFTQLEAELEAELEKRRLQDAYYRDKLLTFEEKAS